MSEILPWAENSKETLNDLLETTSSFSYREAKETMIRGIQDVVLASAPKRTELLTRYVLNRALKTHALIEREVDTTQPGVVDLQVRFLRNSIQMALKYFVSDVAYLNGRFVEEKADLTSMPYAEFGLDYAQFLMQLDQSVLDASAQYAIAIQALGLLEWDLYRDPDRLLYAPVISKIDRFLKLAPALAGASAVDSIRWLRKVKKVYQDSFKTLISLRKQVGRSVQPGLDPASDSGTFNTRRKDFNYGMSIQGVSQFPTILNTCLGSASDVARLRCYNVMLDTLPQDKELSTFREACAKMSSIYHSTECVGLAMAALASGQNYLLASLDACYGNGAPHEGAAGCLTVIIKATQDYTLAAFNEACTALGNATLAYNCQRIVIADVLIQTEIHQLVIRACELIGVSAFPTDAGRVSCYRRLLPEFGNAQLNAIALGCAVKGSYKAEAECISAAIASRVPRP